MKFVDYYFDCSCPWSYLALLRLRDATDRNATGIHLKPVVVDTVLATENPARQANRFSENPAKEAWQRKDIDDWAGLWGLTIKLGDGWPWPSAAPINRCAFGPPALGSRMRAPSSSILIASLPIAMRR